MILVKLYARVARIRAVRASVYIYIRIVFIYGVHYSFPRGRARFARRSIFSDRIARYTQVFIKRRPSTRLSLPQCGGHIAFIILYDTRIYVSASKATFRSLNFKNIVNRYTYINESVYTISYVVNIYVPIRV